MVERRRIGEKEHKEKEGNGEEMRNRENKEEKDYWTECQVKNQKIYGNC